MVTHVVLVQPKADISLNQLQTIFAQVKGLQTHIPEIKDVQVGKNLGHRQEGYSYGLVMHFDSLDALNTYSAHPAHVAVAKELISLCDNLIEFDLAQ
jgi:hypothetical protein